MLSNELDITEVLQRFDALKFETGNIETIAKMAKVKPMQPFSEQVISFLNDLAKLLMKSGKEYSDVATFGFWCRKSAILREKGNYDDIDSRLGRGVVFHSTPSNVPVNFAFSFAAGLLAGNANIVRLPGKPFEQVTIICQAINELLMSAHSSLKSYICMLKYPPVKEITDVFSSICDTRVVWGGDGTINEMRMSPLKPRATEITFADRYSIAVINADEYLKTADKDAVTQNFYNDTYFSDQNACTAPRILIWLGKNKELAQNEFWSRITKAAADKYAIKPVQAVGKLHATYKVAACLKISKVYKQNSFVTRLKVHELTADLIKFKYNSGFFFEYDAENWKEITPVCDERCQTLTYFGFSKGEVRNFLHANPIRGVDRAVPLGKSMDFTLVWDGYDLIRSLSRKVSLV